MQIQTIVGPQGPSSAGSGIQNLRGGASGEVVVQELHGRYYETAARKAIFAGANTAGVTTSAGFATTCTGLILTNPTGSTVNLVLNKVSYAALVAQTAALARRKRHHLGHLVGAGDPDRPAWPQSAIPRQRQPTTAGIPVRPS